MKECISLKGLRILSKMDKNSLPENWKVLVMNYLQSKEDFMNNSIRKNDFDLGVFAEAVKLAQDMGILWKIRLNY